MEEGNAPSVMLIEEEPLIAFEGTTQLETIFLTAPALPRANLQVQFPASEHDFLPQIPLC